MKTNQIKKAIMKEIKSTNNAELSIKIYDTDEEGIQEYIVEFFLKEDGSYYDAWVSEIYTDLSEAQKKAKSLVSTIKDWGNENLAITTEIQVYSA